MKRKLFLYMMMILFFPAIAYCAGKQVKVSVKNDSQLARINETVELSWEALSAKLTGIEKNNVVVFDAKGKEVPSQVVFGGKDKPVGLIFQANVKSGAVAKYVVKKGAPAVYKKQAYGRFVPERMDDFAWENNLIGHRMYGPALEATGELSNGIDVWVKKTDELLINEWYKTGDYHRDHGKGMDCYKVGRTLGAGAMAPYVDGKLWFGNNYVNYTVLDNGPLRISFRLTYAPFKVNGNEVVENRVITLDANTHFSRIEEVYENAAVGMPVVSGIVLRKPKAAKGKTVVEVPDGNILDATLMDAKRGVMAYWEPQNNDNGTNNGHTAVGIVFPKGAKDVLVRDGHLLLLSNYDAAPFIYYMGAGWSKFGFKSSAEWFDLVKQESERRQNPLSVKMN